jgi:predicted RNase H-like HicB family nuclease
VKFPVLVEPIAGNGYRACGSFPFEYTTEGATPDEAVQKLKQLIQNRLTNGAELISLEVPKTDNPWVRLEGIYKDDPLFDEWQAAIAEYRKQADLEVETP